MTRDAEYYRVLARAELAAAEAKAAVFEAAAREASAQRRDWTDQGSSPLGRRRHVAAVRRRVDAGDEGAAMVGRRAMLSASALADELAAASTSKRPALAKPDAAAGPDALRAKFGLVGGSRR